MPFPIKVVGALVGLGGVGGGIAGILHLTKVNKGDQTPYSQSVNSNWKNYLVQTKQSIPEDKQAQKTTCVFNETCKFYSRNDKNDETHAKTKRSNLTKVDLVSDIKSDVFYVLSIDNKTLEVDSFIDLTSDNKDQAPITAQIISQMSITSENYRLPKPPKTILPKEEWIDINKLNLSSPNEVSKLENRLFNNSIYPTNINRTGIDHKSYMVFKWQERVLMGSKYVVHANIQNLFYIPDNIEDLKKEYKPNESGAEYQKPIFMHPTTFANNEPQEDDDEPGDGFDLQTLNKLDATATPVDAYLFKTFAEQQKEAKDQGEFEILLTEYKDTSTSEHHKTREEITDSFKGVFVEIYQIADQANITKALPEDKQTSGKADSVDWETIDKDDVMITKFTEMKEGKYYKFVFSDEEIVKKALTKKLGDISGILNSKSETVKEPNKHGIFDFLAFFNDFYCVRSSEGNKCEYFK